MDVVSRNPPKGLIKLSFTYNLGDTHQNMQQHNIYDEEDPQVTTNTSGWVARVVPEVYEGPRGPAAAVPTGIQVSPSANVDFGVHSAACGATQDEAAAILA